MNKNNRPSTGKIVNLPIEQPETVLNKFSVFTANLVSDEIEGNVVITDLKEAVLKLCITTVARIAIDDKIERFYHVLKVNYPEYFFKEEPVNQPETKQL